MIIGAKVIGLIPARGGSKSIIHKNIALLNGHRMISYAIKAAQASHSIDSIYCSTDSPPIAQACIDHGVSVIDRPAELASDNSPVLDTIIHAISHIYDLEGAAPAIVVLLQPTSPFLLPEHIDKLVQRMHDVPHAASGQTVASFPHNFHAYNQRKIENGTVEFVFPKERAACYNKQSKPKFYIFGNLVIFSTENLLQKRQIFGQPSVSLEIPYPYALDVDGPEDLITAEWYLEIERVDLPHMH